MNLIPGKLYKVVPTKSEYVRMFGHKFEKPFSYVFKPGIVVMFLQEVEEVKKCLCFYQNKFILFDLKYEKLVSIT